MRERLFSDREFYMKLRRLTLPIALQSLMLAAVAAGDAVMLGRVTQNSMAAVSLATQVQFIQNMMVSAVVGAGSVLGAQYWGKGDAKSIDDVFLIMIRASGLISLVFWAGCVFAPRFLMLAFTHDPALMEIGAAYLRIAGWSYLMTGVSQCYLTIMKVSDHAAHSAWIGSGAVIINIALNALFIFGLLGLPALGARGAAVATLLARAIELSLCVAFSRRPGFIRPNWRRLLRRNRLLSLDFWKICWPMMGAALSWGVGFTGYTAIIGHMGSDAAAANSVAAVVRDLVCCMCIGISVAGGIVVGNELGAGALERGKLYGERLMKLSFLIGLISAAIVLAATPLVLWFMIMTPQARQYLAGMMAILSVYMIGRSVSTVVINGIFAAGGDTLFDIYSLAVCMWGIAVPTALIGAFALHWPVLAVYACTCLDEVGKVPWVIAHFRKYKWVRDLTRDRAG